MASGINGPGNIENAENHGVDSNGYSAGESSNGLLQLQTGVSGESSGSNDVENCTSDLQGQLYDVDDEDKVGLTAHANPPRLPDGHLSFTNLMAHQYQDDVQAATDVGRKPSFGQRVESGSTMGSDRYNPLLRTDSSLNEEMEKVFDDKPPVAEPFQLRMDFSRPAMVNETAAYATEQKYGEDDFSSHRRNYVHMYQPMATHLSSRDLKTIQSVNNMKTLQEKSSKQPNRRSSSSGSLASSVTNKETTRPQNKEKGKKKSKKQRKRRRSLTAKMRDQTTGIPEEDESEKDSEVEEDDDDDDVGDDKEETSQNMRHDDTKSIEENKEKGNEQRRKYGTDGLLGGDEVVEGDGKVMFVAEEVDGKAGIDTTASVLFTLGSDDTPKPAAGLPAPGEEEVETPSHQHESSSLQGSSSSSSDSNDEDEERDKVESLVTSNERAEEKSIKKRHKHHHHRRRHKGVKIQRRMSGLRLKELDEQKGQKMALDEDGLEKADIEALKSHRYEDRGGIRKHLLHRPVKKRKMRTELEERKVHDRKPHEVFVELDELISGEWKETARWIKFEEDVEESQMWGKPRVASLSFHSLLELRRTIEKGAVMLDLERGSLTEVANAVVDEMVKTGQIRGEDQGNVLRVLLSKHKHNTLETGLQYNLSKASFSSFFNSQSYAARLNAVASSPDGEAAKPLLATSNTIDIERGQNKDSRFKTDTAAPPHVSIASPSAKDIKIMKKIPDGAEATAVLVGNVEYLEQPTMAFVRLAAGTDLENVVALPIPVRFLFILLGPSKPDYDYHEIGRSISTLMADQEFRIVAYAAEKRSDLLCAINEFLDDSIVLPPGQLENPDLLKNITKYQKYLAQRGKKRRATEDIDGVSPPPEEKDPLRRTKRCFGGLIADVKRRYPLYLSDITDAFNLQCLASIIFIYFAALSPVITFGGLLGEKTNGYIGVSEMILGCCISACLFGLFSGQPLLVVGSTGPLLVFEEAVFNFALGGGLPYLACRFWIGLWICIISVLVVAFEGSFLVRYVTRFTQEIFSVLISLIFIFETFSKLARTYKDHPLQAAYPLPVNETELSALYNCSFERNGTQDNGTIPSNADALVKRVMPNTALLSTLLMFGTFIIAYFLRQFKNSKFLRSSVRRTIGDFGVPIAIVAMLIVDVVISETYTQKLNVPQGLSPTDPSKRGWLVSPLGPSDNPLPVWMIFASVIPAFLVFILIFMESHITEVIVSAKERKLKKGTGFHLNLLVLGILNLFVSIFGMPWVCCAAVRSITHTNSLTVMSKTQAPGEKPRIEGLLEQRVTVFVVNVFLGLSILMQPLLREIPLAVLFGIFLYMGVTSLTGVQFVDRIKMLFMPAKNYPDFSYVKAVRALRIHLFTLIEAVCLAVLWVVKSTAASIAFPFALVLTIPLRFFVLPRIFTSKEISELDNSGNEPSVTSKRQDEYNEAQVPD